MSLEHLRAVVDRLMGGRAPSFEAVAAALWAEGVKCLSVERLLPRLGYQIRADPHDLGYRVVVPTGERTTGADLIRTLELVTRTAKAADDSFRFAATLRLLLLYPKAPRLQRGYAREVVERCHEAGVGAVFDQRRTKPRACVLRLLDRCLEGWARDVYPRACRVCGVHGSHVIMLADGPVCSTVGAATPCVMSTARRPSEELFDLVDPWEAELSVGTLWPVGS